MGQLFTPHEFLVSLCQLKMEGIFQKIAQDLQDEVQAAVAAAEELAALSKADTEAAADALIEKADVLRRCENQARNVAEAYFSNNSAILKARFREEMLAGAALKLRGSGRPSEEIAAMLGVDADFVKKHT